MLMKWGLYDANLQPVLSAFQVAALRMLSSGLVMLPFLLKALKEIPKKLVGYILLSGWLGSFFPSFLFCIAETKVDGSLAGSLNALTPLFVVITGPLFFKIKTNKQKIIGVIIGLIGCALLTFSNYTKPVTYIAYTALVIIATILYGFNVNMVQKRLHGVRSTSIAALAFCALIPPSLIVLIVSDFFKLPLTNSTYVISITASCVLGILGTAMASICFYMLVKRAGGLFASLVTYGIPFVAIGWGLYYNEHISYLHIVALVIILLGVYMANRQKRVKKIPNLYL